MATGCNYIGTLNNFDCVPHEYLEGWLKHCNYVCGQVEKGENGTPHIQFFLNLKNKSRITALKKIDSKAHFELVKINNGADTYCMKEETRVEGPWSFGIKPA